MLGSDRISFLKGRSQLILISLGIPYNCFSWVVYLLVWYQHLRNVQLKYLVSVTWLLLFGSFNVVIVLWYLLRLFNNSLFLTMFFFHVLYVLIKKIKVILIFAWTRKNDDYISVRFIFATIFSIILKKCKMVSVFT